MNINFRLFLLILFFGCNLYGQQSKPVFFEKESFVQNVKILSSDEFQGRKPGTIGEKKTLQYLVEKFAEAGTSPGNGDSYFQEVPLLDILPLRDSVMTVTTSKEKFILKNIDDYIIWTEKPDPELTFKNDEVVFAGYGITAPEYNWDDYSGMDVKGKIVLVLSYEPHVAENGKELFKGEDLTWYGIWRYKVEEAARRGAKGCLIINDSINTSSYKSKVGSFFNGVMSLDNRANNVALCDIVGFLSEKTGEKLLLAAGKGNLQSEASIHGFKGIPLDIRLSVSLRTKVTRIASNNVIAKIAGTKRPNETIIFTAHWDHLGIGQPDAKGDSIYNGALDDACGVSEILELAKVFASLNPKPERTILFIATTAEEKGLLGAKWYVSNSIYPLHKTVANINLDGFPAFGRTKDLFLAGIGQNELEDLLHKTALLESRYVNFDIKDKAGVFYRSDQLPFAKAGVPVMFPYNGNDYIDKNKVLYWQEKEANFSRSKYHRPSDEFDNEWDIDGALKNTMLYFLMAKNLAFSNIWPKWKVGSEFKTIRENSLDKNLGNK